MGVPVTFSDGLAAVSLVISLWSAWYGRKNYIASTYPRCHVSLRLVSLDGAEHERPPHHLKIDVRNLHPQVSMSNVEVKIYISEPTMYVEPRESVRLRRTKWIDLMTCAPIGVIEPTRLVTFEPVDYEVNNLEDAICVRLPQYLALRDMREFDKRLEEMSKKMRFPLPKRTPAEHDNQARVYEPLMLDRWLRIRVEITYTPGFTGSKRHKRDFIWALQPKTNGLTLSGWELLQSDPTHNPRTGRPYGRQQKDAI